MGLFGPPDTEVMKQYRDVKGLTKALKYTKDHKNKLVPCPD